VVCCFCFFFFFQAEDGIRDHCVTGVQTCALPILSSMVFGGVFDRYRGLKVGSVEHEASWLPHWLKQMDFTYRERPVFTKGWKSRSEERRVGKECRSGWSTYR